MLFKGIREDNESMWSKATCKEKKKPTCKLKSFTIVTGESYYFRGQ